MKNITYLYFTLLICILYPSVSHAQCTLNNAPPGEYIDTTTCQYVKAPAGTYSLGGNVTAPIDCSPGKFQSDVGSTECLNCTAGSFQSNFGSTECIDCPPGKFQPDEGSTGCLNCALGKYQANAGSTECINCPPGRFQHNEGSTECENCPAGKYQANSGSIECIDCAPGKFQANEGSTQCENCPVGTYQSNTGSVTCVNCAEGTTTSGPGAVTCDVTLNLQKSTFSDIIKYYPNPSNGDVTFDLAKNYNNLNLEVIDSYGKKLLSKTYQNIQIFKINMNTFSSGNYIFKIWSDKEIAVFSIIKQ